MKKVTHWVVCFCILSSTFLFAGAAKWTSRGPYGTGGADGGIFTFNPTDPNLIFVSMFGGVWRSINGGKKWQRIYFEKGNPANLPFYERMTPPRLVIHPKKTDTIIAARFFGFSSYGVISIFKSTDRGTKWELIHQTVESPWDRSASITDAQFHSQDPNVLYVSFYHKGMIKSIDGGKSWQTINTGLPAQEFDGLQFWDCLQIAVDPTNGERIYTLMGDGKVYKSENAGATWISMSEGLSPQHSNLLKIVPKNSQILYVGGRGGIYKTNDGASHWEKLPCKCKPASFAVDPINSNILYYTDWVQYVRSFRYKTFVSKDAGKKWTELPVTSYRPSNAQIAVHMLKHNNLFIEDNEGIYRSTNFGRSWHSFTFGIDNEPVKKIAIDSSDPGHILAARDDILGLGFGRIFESRNGGGSWTVLLRSPFEINDVQFHPADPKVIVAAGRGIAISSDGGSTWRFNEGISVPGVALDPQNPDIIYLPYAKSTDRGRTWSELSTPDPQNAYSIFADPHEGSTLFLITFPPKLYRSMNSGDTWTQIGRGFKEWTGGLLFDPVNPRIIYNPGDRGIYKSWDLGISWALKRNGLPSRYCCTHLVMDATDSKVLYTVGYSNQIFRSKDSGETWAPFPARGLEKVGVTALTAHPTKPGTLFAGTDTGVYTFSFSGKE